VGVILDASTPTNTAIGFGATTVTSASFSPPAASIIEVVVIADGAATSTQSVTSITNSGTALTWQLLVQANTALSAIPGLGGTVETWWAYNDVAQTGITVTANFAHSSVGTVSPGGMLQVLVFTGAAASQGGAAAASVSQTDTSFAPSGSIVTTTAGSWVWGAILGYTSGTVGSPGPAPIYSSQANVTDGDAYWIQQQTAPTLTAGTSVTIGDNSPAECYNMVVWEVISANPGGPATPSMPASGVPFINPYQMHAEAFITGGTVTAIKIDGQTLGVTSGPIIVPIGHTITLTYSVAPTWIWILF
jgi:hypothetical protein